MFGVALRSQCADNDKIFTVKFFNKGNRISITRAFIAPVGENKSVKFLGDFIGYVTDVVRSAMIGNNLGDSFRKLERIAGKVKNKGTYSLVYQPF